MIRHNDVLEICTAIGKKGRENLHVYIKDYMIELPLILTEKHFELLDMLIDKEFGIHKDRALTIIPPANTSLMKVEKCRKTSLSIIYPSLAPL